MEETSNMRDYEGAKAGFRFGVVCGAVFALSAVCETHAATVDFPTAGGDLATAGAGAEDTVRIAANGTYTLSEDQSWKMMVFSNAVTDATLDFGSSSRKLTISPGSGIFFKKCKTGTSVSFFNGQISTRRVTISACFTI